MASFPKLKTNAVAQYPAKKEIRFRNQAVRFLDGTEQRYRDAAGALRRWEISLDQLDEAEMAALEEFFAENQGAFGEFLFTDPWDAQTYSNCSLETDELDMTTLSEVRGRASVIVTENRG